MTTLNATRAYMARHHGLLLSLPLLAVPMAQRFALWGTESAYGYLSDLLAGVIALLFAWRLPALALACLLAVWTLVCGANLELISAVGRMPSLADATYLTDPDFVGNSTGGGLAHPLFVLAMALTGSAAVLARSTASPGALPRSLWLLPLVLWGAHHAGQYLAPSAAEPWKQFSLAHKLGSEALARFDLIEDTIADDESARRTVDVTGLTRQDLDGKRLIGNGKAKNVLIITMEGIPGAYVQQNREATGYQWDQEPMPKLSAFARDAAMQTPDYVLHSHQTIRGLYAMLCGDYSKLDNGTPKGVELLTRQDRNQQCLPAQMARHGFSTHFLQGAGLVFMSKDKIMPHMGFQQTHGREWFTRKPYYEFAWGMDDKSFFEGAFDYISQLRQSEQPWMLTLLTVGTHQPYAASPEYIKRYGSAKMASVAYLDEAVTALLEKLKAAGVMEDTLVIVTSDESHGIENVRLASAWGLNLVFAPEHAELPRSKPGVYGHVDMTASVLDYFGFKLPPEIAGRSLFRDYSGGREMISYTNGFLRYMDRKGNLSECDFQNACREYRQGGHFIAPAGELVRQFNDGDARRIAVRAQILDQSLTAHQNIQSYQFASGERRKLKRKIADDWTDNLIGAQYMEFAAGTRTTVQLKIKALDTDRKGAKLRLTLKEFDRDTDAVAPALPVIKKGGEMEVMFDIDNPKGRKAFSFHLLGLGKGEVEISEFSVTTRSPLAEVAL